MRRGQNNLLLLLHIFFSSGNEEDLRFGGPAKCPGVFTRRGLIAAGVKESEGSVVVGLAAGAPSLMLMLSAGLAG